MASCQQRCSEYAAQKRRLEDKRNDAHNRRQDARRQEDELAQRQKELQTSLQKMELKVCFCHNLIKASHVSQAQIFWIVVPPSNCEQE